MKKIAICITALAVFQLISIIGCKKEGDFPQNSRHADNGVQGIAERNEGGLTVLGPKRTIPYQVDIVKQAYNNLHEPDISSLSPSYLYVRFLPQNPQDVKKLLNTGFEFWDFPLDNEIVSFGEKYHDPTVADSTFTWQYAVVGVNAPLPTVQYEILEQLALVPEDCAMAQEAFRLTGNSYQAPDVFVPDPTIINGQIEYLEAQLPPDDQTGGGTGHDPEGDPVGNDCNCPTPNHIRKPSGCVQVFDNMLNGYEGVKNVEVITSRTQIFGVVFNRRTETDYNGCWEIDHNYHGSIHVWVRWESGTCDIKTMESDIDLWGYIFTRKAYIGSFGGPNFNNIPIQFNFTNAINSFNFRNWVASTANNSVYEFGGFAVSQGLLVGLPDDLQILIDPWGDGNVGSTPMLDKMGAIQQILLLGTPPALLAGIFHVTGLVASVPIDEWLIVFAPDITLNLNAPGNVNADDIRELIYHELSHALHFNKVGSNYWLSNIAYVILHPDYGDGTAAGAGTCSVIESWGFQIGRISTHLRYGTSNSNVGNPILNTWRARLELNYAWARNNDDEAHIPWGWEWDLQDNNTTNPANEDENPIVTDRVYGITEAQIFSQMTSSMHSIPDLKTALIQFLPSGVSSDQYNLLSSAYGF